ncbi:MAG TPA: hypothetical protein VGI58_13890 [Streptosporangiaceae bacterium]
MPPIKVGLDPGAMVVTPNGVSLYVTNSQSDVYPISTVSNKAGPPIFFGFNGNEPLDSAGALSVTPSGGTIYVATSNAIGDPGAILPIATATNTVGAPITVSSDPISVVVGPHGKTAYALDQISTS